MKKKINVVLFLIFIFIITVSFFLSVSAGGGLIVLKEEGWEMLDEEQQLCAINYHQGIQNMIIGVSTDKEIIGEKAVWIFPVPAKPEEVSINIVKEFPMLSGFDVRYDAAYFYEEFDLIRASQIYTLYYSLREYLIGDDKGISGIMTDPFGEYIGGSGVTINKTIEKNGLTTELVSAFDSSSFSNYLVSKNLDVPPNFKSILDEYIGEEYSFVVSWISDVEEFKLQQPESYIISLLEDSKIDEARELFDSLDWDKGESDFYYFLNRTFEDIDEGEDIDKYDIPELKRVRGTGGNILSVFISFPTDKIYYPLKPTSVYESKRVPVTIYVLGYAKPELYPKIKAYSEVNYVFVSSSSMYGESFKPKEELRDFFIGYDTKELKFTKIKIDSPSKYLTGDLWIKKETPFNVLLSESKIRFTFLFDLFLFVICSCLASLLSGIIVFGFKRTSKIKFMLFGLWNFLTLIGFSVVAYANKIDVKFAGLEEIKEDKNKRIMKFIVLFTVLFMLLTFLFEYLLNLIFA